MQIWNDAKGIVMVVNKRKKNRAMRGSRTHGWGHPKKHRGKGSRGGVGKSGMGKRGQHKMSLLNSLGIKNIGAHGFKRPQTVIEPVSALNLRDIELHIDNWLKKGLAAEDKNVITIDMSKLCVTKVLGSGHISRKMIISADRISASAKEKIEKAGGKAEAMIVEADEGSAPKAPEAKGQKQPEKAPVKVISKEPKTSQDSPKKPKK